MLNKRRLRFWKPKSVTTDPAWDKKVRASRAAMKAFDQLPLPIRHALNRSSRDFSAEQILDLWYQTAQMQYATRINYIVRTIKANDRH